MKAGGRMVIQDNRFQQLLVGEELSGVTFVRDYLQLQFNAPLLNAYTPVTVQRGDHRAVFGETVFANLLIGQIGKVVRSAGLRADEALDITFDDNSKILISLRPEDYVVPEAIMLSGRNGECIVI